MASSLPPPSPDKTNTERRPAPLKSINSAIDPNPPRLQTPRSIPPWVTSYETNLGPAPQEQLDLLQSPSRTVQPVPNSIPHEPQRRVSKDGFVSFEDPALGPARIIRSRIPHFLRYGRASIRGRKWDHLRTAEPVIVSGYNPATARHRAAWRDFVKSSRWGRPQNEQSHIIDPETLDKLQPGFNEDLDLDLDHLSHHDSRRRKTKTLYKRMWNMAIRHSLSPLVFRLTVIITSILALAVSARIYKLETSRGKSGAEQTQSVVAVVVDCVAIPYSAYMIWDEYTGKPIGLRSAYSKISLILLDLFFIIFKSASTALAFEALLYHNVNMRSIAQLAEVLAAFMLIGLISWTMNLTVNVFRTVERLGGGDENDG